MSDLSNTFTLDFERPVRDLENQIEELKQASLRPEVDISSEIKALQKKVSMLIKEIYGNLSSWERVQLSRHPNRPHTIDYVKLMVDEFHDIAGDRHFADDQSMIAGFGYMDGQKVAVVGIEKGRKTKEKVTHNFGMPRPEGYRKALRVMKMASRFGIPIIALVDTPGAYPGIGAEERGQASAIAENLTEMFDINAPIVAVVIGEGGSGGALGIAVADKVLMMEYSVYSVISPESCASILWADPKMAETAANGLQLGPDKALELNVIDSIIPEPAGGAHRDWNASADVVKKTVLKEMKTLLAKKPDQLKKKRYEKFRQIGNQTLVWKK
ncbi:acetyl-CoA carboxylase carboxyltransferase subunit alpha [Idiomarina sp. UBA4206]|uniref:acetyl-CoA carboxylase carboxyltransferase subunit alpha n=1 Tax=Idiomarina sp. UBA4206 TaxID=1946644 RepID=UPI00257EDB95|nr:acetyl-CoA carboxylase carboxyltransferase subunit alpha [Idiomarina sp. UBA4206]